MQSVVNSVGKTFEAHAQQLGGVAHLASYPERDRDRQPVPPRGKIDERPLPRRRAPRPHERQDASASIADPTVRDGAAFGWILFIRSPLVIEILNLFRISGHL